MSFFGPRRKSTWFRSMKRRPVNGRVKRTSYASTRRRGTAIVLQRKPRYSRYAKSKTINYNRVKVGLPPLELKYVNDDGTNIFVAQTATNWSSVINSMSIPLGTGPNSRESQKIKTEPFKIRGFIKQQENSRILYRFLVIKVFDDSSSPPNPQDVLTNYDETDPLAYTSSYVQDQDRSDIRYKVLKDFHYQNSTYYGRNTIKNISFKVPVCNLNFNDNDPSAISKNKIYICLMTSAPTASADYALAYTYTVKFQDQ